MRTLILCIDRDNDLGVKAGVRSPVIGRADNINAAVALASKDPEDSDLNTIFGGVRVYDTLSAEGSEVEIVSLAGDRDVGVKSDMKIAQQLDRLLEERKFDRAILISDGAEDESLLPIVQSRIKVDSVSRIVVKQAENLESTYYIIKQAFNDPKISHTFFVPIGLALIIYAISAFVGYTQGALIAITAAIGMYLLFRGFGLDDAVDSFKNSMKESLYGGKISFVTYTAAIILAVIATLQGTSEFWMRYNEEVWHGYLILFMFFVNASIWWYVAAGLAINIGKIIDLRLEKKSIGRNWSYMFFIFASGLLFWGGSTFILSTSGFMQTPFGEQFLLAVVGGAVAISILGAWISSRARETFEPPI